MSERATGPKLDEESLASRREVLGLMGGGALLPLVAACQDAERTPAMTKSGLAEPLYLSSAVALASAIRERRIASLEVVEACLDRIEEVNPSLNAVVQLGAEEARRQAREADAALARGEARGPLHGVPMTIKDSLDTAGMITTGGTKGRASFVPERDATVVARLRDAGAILLGKTNTPEFTLSFETDNLIYGPTSNPWDLSRTSGGSSGGAAAIVAAGGAPFDIGSDYGGSIRLPSHFCGIAGIKPSSGRVPRTGHIYPFGGIQDSLQQIGPLARYVEDLALLLPLIAGPDGIDPAIVPMPLGDPATVELGKLRISFHTDNGIRTPTAETVEAVRAAATALEPHVLALGEAKPTGIDETMELLPLYSWDGGAAVARLQNEAGTTESSLGEAQPALSAVQLDALVARWWAWRSRLHTFFQDYDVILAPVNAGPALPHGSVTEPGILASFSYTMAYNLTGWPGAVVRGGTSPEGLPIGLQVVARPWREDVALAVAAALESELGGYRPPQMGIGRMV